MGIRIVLADDHRLFREGMRALLGTQGELEVVGDAGEEHEAREMIRALRPDVAILDVSLRGRHTTGLVRELRAEGARTRTLILSGSAVPADVQEMVSAGAAGYVPKEAAGEEVVRAVRAVARGRGYLSASVTLPVLRRSAEAIRLEARHRPLTERHLEVLECLTAGAENREIADRLGITEFTVKVHLRSIFEKIGARNRAHAVTIALGRGLIPMRAERPVSRGAASF